MSWFDASNFANLAKNALKEAQKTIDKALDITEDEEEGTFDCSGFENCSNPSPFFSFESSAVVIFEVHLFAYFLSI